MKLNDIILKLASEHWVYADIKAGIIETMSSTKPSGEDIKILNNNGYFEIKCDDTHPDLSTFRFTTDDFDRREKLRQKQLTLDLEPF